MKSLKLNLFVFLILGSISLNLNAQEKNEQLWICGEEIVKPAFIDEYIQLSKEFIDICRQEKFPFAFYVWTSKPFVYELWYPVGNLNTVLKIDSAWKKVIEKFGAEKYAAFNNTKVKNRSFSSSMRNDLHYIPKNPDYNIDDAVFFRCMEYSLIPGKQKEFEETVKWMNGQRETAGAGHIVYYRTGGLGYDDPVYIEMIGATSEEDFVKRTGFLGEKMTSDLKEYRSRINSITREKNTYNLWFLKELSYEPAEIE